MTIAQKGRATAAKGSPLESRFDHIADRLTTALGSFYALLASVLVVAVWAATGPIFNFSDTWQLVINTGTTVVTFWMVFVIQNSANRSAKATRLKLDELIRALEAARDDFIEVDEETESEMNRRQQELAGLAHHAK